MSIDPKANYYDAGGIEVMDIIKAKLTSDQFVGFCLGNSMKYILRLNFKHNSVSLMKRDIEKSMVYLKEMKDLLDEQSPEL